MKWALLVALTVFGETLALSPPGDVVGKLVIGYQGWFAVQGDGSPLNRWIHWTKDGSSTPPARNNCHFEVYPDFREYTKLYPTQLANLGNGQPAQVFSSYDDSTFDLHFRWMQQYGIEVVALSVCSFVYFLL